MHFDELRKAQLPVSLSRSTLLILVSLCVTLTGISPRLTQSFSTAEDFSITSEKSCFVVGGVYVIAFAPALIVALMVSGVPPTKCQTGHLLQGRYTLRSQPCIVFGISAVNLCLTPLVFIFLYELGIPCQCFCLAVC